MTDVKTDQRRATGATDLEQTNAFWYAGQDGARLRAAAFQPSGAARGSVILSPGRTEFIEKYREVTDELLARGFAVLVHDWRGQGLSDRILPNEPLKGCAHGAALFLEDYAQLLSEAATRGLPRPWIGMGHSMGGALTLLAHLDKMGGFAGVALSAPMLGIRLKMPAWLAGLIASGQCAIGRSDAYAEAVADPLKDAFSGNRVTHDEARWRRTQAIIVDHPEIALGAPTWGWVDFALKTSAEIRRRAGELRGRMLDGRPVELHIVAAGDDQLADTAAARQVAADAGQSQYFSVADGAWHEVLMERDAACAIFWRSFDDMASRLPPRQ